MLNNKNLNYLKARWDQIFFKLFKELKKITIRETYFLKIFLLNYILVTTRTNKPIIVIYTVFTEWSCGFLSFYINNTLNKYIEGDGERFKLFRRKKILP